MSGILNPIKVKEDYIKWLEKEITVVKKENEYLEINAPFLDRYNDYLQVYAKIEKNEILLTDDSYIINNLINLYNKKNKSIYNILHY